MSAPVTVGVYALFNMGLAQGHPAPIGVLRPGGMPIHAYMKTVILPEKEIVPLRTKREALKIEDVRQMLGDGAAKARTVAEATMKQVRTAMGLGSLAVP